MSPLSPEELATIERLKAGLRQPAAPGTAAPDGVRPERFTDFPIGMSDDGELLVVPAPVAPASPSPSPPTGKTKP